MIIKDIVAVGLALFSLSVSSGCKQTGKQADASLEREVVTGYATLVHATYSDALLSAQELQQAVSTFLAAPDSQSHQAAKTAWIEARKWYSQTEAFRFYDGPIDNGETGIEPLINAWPLDEVYVDYVQDKPDGGIIQNISAYPEITRDLVIKMNERGGEENISCGFHAIEFMLWGQDLSATSAGDRPFTDFLAGEPVRDRRRIYLELVTDLLVEHLQQLKDAWSPEQTDNYRALFENDSAHLSIAKIMTGIGVLAKVEMAGERMYTAYDNADQEDEQSCFSDNTLADLQYNLIGINNVYIGTYRTYTGNTISVQGIAALLMQKASDPASELTEQIAQVLSAFAMIEAPFDRAIVDAEKRPAVMEAILAVQKLGNAIASASEAMGYTINITETE